MRSRDIALASLFGVVISIDKVLLPPPYDKMASVFVQITFLSLSFLMMGFPGPVLVGFVSGLLTAAVRGGWGLLSFLFALLYGVFVSSINLLIGVIGPEGVRKGRLIASSLISTLLIGTISAVGTILLGVIPYEPTLVLAIIVAGGLQGLVGGYVGGALWERWLRDLNIHGR